MNKRTWIIIGIVVVVLFFIYQSLVGPYNNMVKMNQEVKGQWGNVEVQYQRRMDLIPNLVETVKGYANFEKSTLTDVVEARANATKVTLTPEMLNDPQAMKNFEQAQGAITSSLSRLMAVSERYPDLKANQSFLS